MRKVLGSLSLLVLLLNTLLTPITYAGEYEEIIVISSDSQKNQVEENGEEDKAPEFSVEEKKGDEENTGGIVDDGDDLTGNILTGDIAGLDTGEIEDIIGGNEIIITGFDVEDDTGITLDIFSGAFEVSFGSGDISEEVIVYNSESIIGEKTYDNVTVKVEALSGIFPEGTELLIEPIKWWNLSNLKDKLIEEKEEIRKDTTVVAFDITFIYSGEEVQPRDGGKVKVTFDYSNNEDLVKADNNDEQEVKVYHVEDKDEEGNELEKGEDKIVDVTNVEESEEDGVAVADGERFSIYAVVIITGDATSVSIVHNLNGGYWMEGDNRMSPRTIEYTCTNGSCTTTTRYRTPSRTGFMFMGWFTDELGTTKRKGEAEDGREVYAKWQEFGDLDIIFLGNQSNSGHYTLMDRNMGAKVVYDGNYSSPNDGSRGYYYQWGNNYGFDEYNSNNDPLSPIEPETDNVSSYTLSSLYYSFLFRGKDDATIKNWMTSLNKKLRGDDGSNNEVSRQGPCPDGYHIPTKAEYENILLFYNNLKNNSTKKLTRYLLMPPAGIRDRGFSNLGTVANPSYYRYITSSWNSNDYSNKAVWFLGADGDSDVKLDKEWSANGLSARCFKNNKKLNDRYNIDLNGGENAIISILSGVVQSIQEPYKNFYDFDGWYTSSDFEGDPIEVGSTLLSGSSLYAKWIGYDRYTITYNLNGGFMKFSNKTRETNIQEYAENTNTFTLKNPVKLNSVFIGWSGTNLSSPTLTVTIPKGSVGNRVYEALYDCEPGYVFNENNDCVGVRNSDGTLNFDEWEYGTVDFGVGDTKITMLDRNLGASTNDISDSDSLGFYYKWGNNYGFSTNHTSKYGATNVKITDVSGYGPGTLSGYYLSHEWIIGGDKGKVGNWFTNVNFDLWGDITDTLQARQGPCPNEYHIPSDNEVTSVINLLSNFAETSSGTECIELYGNKRKCFQNLVKLPDSGYIKSNSESSSLITDTNRIFLWTSSDYNNETITAFHSTQNDGKDMITGERGSAAAMQVRCFKNIDKVKVKYNFNGGYYGDNIYSKPDIEDDWWNLSKQTISPLSLSMKRDNSVFSGWYVDPEFKKEFTGGTILPYATQDITFYAKFNCNDPYVPSGDGRSCIFNNDSIVTYDYQAHSGVNENTTIDVSYGTEITLPSEGIKSQKGYNFIGWTTELGGTEPISNVQTIVGDVTFYPIFKKDSIEKNMTFNLNGSKGFMYSGTNYFTDATLHLCTIDERYNNQEDLTGCEAIIQLPTITGSDNTPYVSGWSTGLDIAAIPVGTNLRIIADEDDIVNFYAQTYSTPKTYRLNYEYSTGVMALSVTSGSCGIAGTVNGVAQSGSCNIELPQLALKIGFKDPLWYKGNHGYTGEVEVFGVGMGNGLNLEDGNVLTGIAHAKDDVKYVVKHYYQMLNADGTELLENQYKSGRIEEKAGLAHSIIELSGEKFDDLMGYTYYTGTIQTTADEVDISEITTATTGEINPEGTLVITLFYTRDTYKVDWIDQGSIVKTENSLPYGVKVNHYKPTDPTKATDEQYTYTFAGWYDEDDDLLTGDTLLTTGTVYTSKYNSETRTYTIIWENSIGTVLETDADVEYGSMPSYDGEEPTSGSNAQYTYYFSGWTPQTGMVVKDQVYTAVYNSSVNQYAITFVDEDGTVLKTATMYDYNTSAVDIVKPADPTKAATAQYTYTFAGWNPTVHDVTGTQVYTATYSSTVNKYTVLWKNRNGAELETDENVEYGSKPKYDGSTPISGETVEYQYRFIGWNPFITNETIIEGDTDYTATYEPIKRKYEITWKDYNDQIIGTTEVEYGVIPTHANPTRTGHDFNVWDPTPVEVTGSTSYKATYTINQYTVTPEKGVGVADILGGGTYDYGTEIVLTGIAKEGYHFEGGENVKEFNILVPAENITVKITAYPNTYYVHFKNNGGEGVMNDQEFTYDQEQALTPNAYTRNGYSFVSWTDGEGGIFRDKAVVKNLVTSGIINLIAQWIEGDVPGPTPPTPTPTPSSGGSGGGSGRPVDKDTDDKQHDSAEEKQQEEIKDNQTKKDSAVQTGEDIKQMTGDASDIVLVTVYQWTEEELTAYKFAYKYGITTLAPENSAMPDEYVQRGHMAKMVVNYALNVLHWKLPEKLPRQCKWMDGPNAWESQEIKDYAEKACALGIMGIDMKYFQPKKYVTRAQFGTIIGRLLRGKMVSKPYYAAHLRRLNERGIMTQIENPEDRIEIRKRAWLMFMRMEKYQ